MKKFSRCVLILIIVAILSGAAGYVYENKKIIPMYESTTQLYVVPGEENEASIRANNGGLKDDFTIKRAQVLGASYFMLKPIDMDVVNNRISDLIAHKDEVLDLKSEKLELGVSSMLHDLGIPSHVRGYQYIREGVLLLYRDEEASVLVTKEIYPKIADKYQTTSSRVERAIRHAIEISWTRGDIKLMEDLFGNSIDFDRSRPTNSEFLTTLADRFKLDNKEMVF